MVIIGVFTTTFGAGEAVVVLQSLEYLNLRLEEDGRILLVLPHLESLQPPESLEDGPFRKDPFVQRDPSSDCDTCKKADEQESITPSHTHGPRIDMYQHGRHC